LRAADATLQHLPQYSPDLNPIEMPFSNSKHFCERSQSELSVVFAVGYVRWNLEITSDMYDWNLI
jgi:hypothetical protein